MTALMGASAAAGAARPRVLAIGLLADELEAIRPLVGSLREASELGDVHPEEYDVLIHTDADFNDGNAFHRRIAFAEPAVPADGRSNYMYNRIIQGVGMDPDSPTTIETQFTLASHFDVTKEARDLGLAGLVERSCVPASEETYTGFNASVSPWREVKALLSERLQRPLTLAAILDSPNEYDPDSAKPLDSAFWLPEIARREITEWIRAAFDYWRARDPEAFPQTAEWRSSNQWGAPSEIEARRELDAFDAEEERRRAEADATRERILDAAESTAEEGDEWRALVSETGDALVSAVRSAFEMLGFSVLDADTLVQHKGKKREDLRVSDGVWTVLVEVKGYTGAAKSNDLQQLTAAATMYGIAEGKPADALWYVVNAFRELDPAQRAEALAGREEDLEAFADSHNGCLIDTRDLFALRQEVALGKLDAAIARDSLKGARARFTADSNAT